MTHSPPRDAMQEIANRIVAELENGVKPWVHPWDPEKTGGPQAPFNPVTGKRYHGINVLILGMDLRAFQSGDPRWMTYQQAQEKHWQVRKDERSTTIFFTKPYEINAKWEGIFKDPMTTAAAIDKESRRSWCRLDRP